MKKNMSEKEFIKDYKKPENTVKEKEREEKIVLSKELDEPVETILFREEGINF